MLEVVVGIVGTVIVMKISSSSSSCVSFYFNGLDEGVDFVGGRTFQVKFEKPVEATQVSEELSAAFGVTVEAKVFGEDDQLKLTTKYKIKEDGVEVDKEVNELVSIKNPPSILSGGFFYGGYETRINRVDLYYCAFHLSIVSPLSLGLR